MELIFVYHQVTMAHQIDCTLCGAGKYSTAFGAAFSATCLMCSPGKSLPRLGSNGPDNCTVCIPGTYTSSPGSSQCSNCLIACPTGWMMSLCSSTYDSACSPPSCPQGFYLNGTECVMCNISRCNSGFYRGACGRTSDAGCLSCSNMPANKSALYVSAGRPFNANNCLWACKPTCNQCKEVCAYFSCLIQT